MPKLLVGLVVAGAAIAVIYVIATTVASSMASAISTTESVHHSRISEFANAMKRASAEHRNASERCGHVEDAAKQDCDAEANADQRRARTEARMAYRGSIASAENSVSVGPNAARKFDSALYRAHRQIP